MNDLSFGQKVDETNGLVMPWLTHGALDNLSEMDMSNDIILQFGSGRGDAWWATRCKKLICIERNAEWLSISQSVIAMNGITNVEYIYRPCNEGSGMEDFYTELPDEDISIIINDDAYRTEVCQVAVDYFKKRGEGILVCDNWHQDYVWISPKAEEIMDCYTSIIYPQLDHKDHEGNQWKTAIFQIP